MTILLLFILPLIATPARAQVPDAGASAQLVTPVPVAAGATAVELYLLNGIQDPIVATVELVGGDGETLHRSSVEIDPSDHRSLPLTELYRGTPTASVRVTHDAGADALQSWLVLRRGHQATELALESPGASVGSTLGSFWDLTGRQHGAQPIFYVLNTTDAPVAFEVVSSEARRRSPQTIAPRGVATVRPSSSGETGWIEIHHDGPEGALHGAGVLSGPGDLGVLPLAPPPTATAYVTIRVPVLEEDAAERPETFVSLFNGSDTASLVSIEVQDALTGDLLHHVQRTLAPREIGSLELATLLGRAAAPSGSEVRVRVEGSQPGLQVDGFTRMSSGAVLELAFFDEASAHGSGHYPLPSLEQNDVFLTVVNLGAEPAEVVAQLFWDDGWTYSYGPVTVEGGASRRLDVRQLAEEATPDLLGRTLDPHYGGGMLKWKVFEGEPTFVARTEVRPVGTEDTFGFNCWGCCWENPWGSVIPSNVSFFLHENPSFQSAVTWDTCSGTMGPYGTTPGSTVVPNPFFWNASNVSASDTAQEGISWEGIKNKITATCQTFLKTITGFGTASTCKHLLRKSFNPAQTWNPNATCTSQVGGLSNACTHCQTCCDQILAWKICTKRALTTANTEHQACLVGCATDICP